MKYRRKTGFAVALCVLMLVSAALSVEVQDVRVESRDQAPLEESSVFAYTSLKPGDEFTRSAVSMDVKNLQESGRFSLVEAVVDRVPGGVAVTYLVRSKPRIRRLRIEGADHLDNKKVRELLDLGIGDLVDDATLAVRAQDVRAEYRKKHYPFVEIDWTISEDVEAGQADVTVRVKEGARATVRDITFRGNHAVSSRTLRGLMQQKQSSVLAWLTGAGRYQPDDLATDVAILREYYMINGFLDVQVSQPDIQRLDRDRIDVAIDIDEGPEYRIGSIDVEGVALFDEQDVERVVKLKRGDVASIEQIRQASQSVRDYYGSRGYIDTLVRYDLDAKPSRGVVDVRFDVQEGELAYIRDIRIRGNTRTQDKVIRRELAVVPGDIFNEVRVRISERRLWNLGFFSFVNSVPEPTAEQDQYDLTFEVEEQKTGQFIVGAGFSSVDDVVGFVELSQGNFDLFGWPHLTGGGQKLKLRSQFGTERTDVELSFVEPWLFNRKLSLGVDLYRHDSRFLSDDYDQRNTGGSVSLARALTRSIRGSLKYAFEEIEVYDLSDDASDRIREEEGSRTKSSMTLGLLRDTRDSVFVPTRGNRTSLSATLAGGPLGAETDLYELEARSSQYIPLWFGHVLNIKGWAAVVEEHGDADRVPIFDRLFLGGARTIRGFRYRDVGPRDTEGEPIGGRTAAYGTAEYSIPLGKTIRFATFYDVGMVWEEAYEMEGDYNSSYGIGLRFDIPGFPLRLDYAWPLETDEYTIIEVGTGLEQTKTNDQPSGRFSFLLGYVF